MYQQGPQGQYPVYLAAQMRVLLVVLRDLAAEGYVSIPWGRLPDHVAMLHKGYKAVRKSFDARNSNEPYDGEGDRYGVVLLD